MTDDEARRYEVGAFTIDVHRRALYEGHGTPLAIPAQAFDALVYLVEKPGVIVSRAELMDALWPDSVVEDNSLSRAILRVRRVLGDGYIETVKGRGYQLVVDVRPAEAEEVCSGAPRTRVAPVVRRLPLRGLAVSLAILGLAALVSMVFRPVERVASAPDPDTRFSEVPTQNRRALELYVSGRRYEQMHNDWDPELVARQYERAIALDPEFALAWARLSIVHNEIFWFRDDVSQARRALAREAAQRAIALDPDLPEARMALGWYRYHIERDLEAALAELERAAAGMPDDGEVHWRLGIVHRRHGDFERALAEFEKVATLSPLDPRWRADLVEIQLMARRYSQAAALCARLLEVAPDDSKALTYQALIPLYRDGDARALRLAAEARTPDTETPWTIPRPIARWLAALYARDFESALEALDDWPGEAWRDGRRYFSKAGLRATTLELAGREADAEASWREARAHVEGVLDQSPDYPDAWMARAEALARTGEGGTAVAEALRVIEHFEATGDRLSASEHRIDAVRRVFVPAGALDEALVALETYLDEPGFWSIEGLLADPRLDPLRAEPRFAGVLERSQRERTSREII